MNSLTASSSPAPRPLSRAQQFRGNASVWLLVSAIGLYKAWLWYMKLPSASEIQLFGGLLDVTVGEMSGLVNFVLGGLGLSAILSISNVSRIFIDFFRPLNLVDDPKLRDFFVSPVTLAFAGAMFFTGVHVALSVWVVEVRSRYELLALLMPGSPARFVSDDGNERTTVRLTKGAPARLVLTRRFTPAVLVLRDKYNFRTLDAFAFERTPLGYSVIPCSSGPSLVSPPAAGAHGSAGITLEPRGFEVINPLRWNADRVGTPLQLADGSYSENGWIRAGDGMDGSERGPSYAQSYLDRLFAERDSVATWYDVPSVADGDRQIVFHKINGFDLSFTYSDRELHCPKVHPVTVRDATSVLAVEKMPTN